MITICATSDFHGILPVTPPSNLLLIAGDIIPLIAQDNYERSLEWLDTTFRNWAIEQETQQIVLVAGNHDIVFQERPDEVRKIFESFNDSGDWFHYLENEVIDLNFSFLDDDDNVVGEETIKIFGTPYCKVYGDWAFMLPDDELQKKFAECPNEVDIILSHDAPYGVTDVCLERIPWAGIGEHLGSRPLRDMINRVNFKYMVHGHLHSSRHSFEHFKSGKVVNVSLLGENYKPAYPPLVFNYE